ARSGARHAMAVNETVIAITRTPATATRPVPRQRPAPMAPPAPEQEPAPGLVLETPGMGWIGSWSTEVPRCPSCRTDLHQQHPTLRQAVFGRRPRSK
ncbi:hypothetical protein ACWDBO_55655, partial [Streptomyces mirabilis]